MPKPKLRIEQPFRNPGFIALLVLLSGLLIYRFALLFLSGGTVTDLIVLGSITLFLGAAWYFMFRSRLRIKVTARYLKVRTGGMFRRRLKLPLAEVEDCSFVEVGPAARWSGALAHPAADFTNIDFGGRRGLCIRMRDGQSYFIGSDALYARRHEVPLPTPDLAS